MSLRLQAFLLLALSAVSTLAQVSTPVTIPNGVGLAALSCQAADNVYLSGTAVVAPNDEIKVTGGKVYRERTVNSVLVQQEITSDFLTGSSELNNSASSGTCVVTMADPCDRPGLLEKTLTPVLLPTSQLIIVGSDAGVQFQVELPNMYTDVKFGFNARDADFAVTDGNEGQRQADQCSGIAPQPVCAEAGCLTGIPTGTCTTEYVINQKLSECNFALNEDGDDPVYSGVLWVYAKVQLDGSFLGDAAFQEVVSPIRWSVSLSRQITVSTNLVTLINANECEEDVDCIHGFCNKGVGLQARECGDFKVAICRQVSEEGPSEEGPSEAGPAYTSMCIPRLDALDGGMSGDIIPAFNGIAGTYAGSNYEGDNIGLHTSQCVGSRPEDAINFCDCDAVGYEKDPADKLCHKDIESPELSCSDVYAVWSDFGPASDTSMIAYISTLNSLGAAGSTLLAAQNPLVTDNGYNLLTLTWSLTQQLASSPFGEPPPSGSSTSTHSGQFGYATQLDLQINPYSTLINVGVNDSNDDDVVSSYINESCDIRVYVFDDEDPSITCPIITPGDGSPGSTFGSGTQTDPLELGNWDSVSQLSATANDRRAGDIIPTLKVFDSSGNEVTTTPDGTGGQTYKLTYTACDGADEYNESIMAGKLNVDNCVSCDIYVLLNTDVPTCIGHSAVYYVTSSSSSYTLTSSNVEAHAPSFGADANYAVLQPYTPVFIKAGTIDATVVATNLPMNYDVVEADSSVVLNADGSLTYGSWKLTNKLGTEAVNACDLTINVIDKWSPTVACPPGADLVQEQILDMSAGESSLLAADAQFYLTAAESQSDYDDNENPNRGSVSCANEDRGTSNWLIGTNTITCRATDFAANPNSDSLKPSLNADASVCTYTVYVADNEDPNFTDSCGNKQTNMIAIGKLDWPATCDATINLSAIDHSTDLALGDNYSNDDSYHAISLAGVTNFSGNDVTGATQASFSSSFSFTYAGKDLASLKGLNEFADHNVIGIDNQCELEMQFADNTPPQLSGVDAECPGDESICMNLGSNQATYETKNLIACDNVATVSQGESIEDGSLLEAATTVIFSANDSANNGGQLCSWVSTPIDCEAPTIDCSSVVGVSDQQGDSEGCAAGVCSYTVHTDADNTFDSALSMYDGMGSDNLPMMTGSVALSSVFGQTTATDVSPVTISSIDDLTNPALKPGIYTLSFTATDGALSSTGQLYPVADPGITGPFSATCQVQLTVKDVIAPTLDCATITTDYGKTYYAGSNTDNAIRAAAHFPIAWLPSVGDQLAGSLAADNSGKIKSVTLQYRKKESGALFAPVTADLQLDPTAPDKDTEYDFKLTVTDYADLESDVCAFTATASDNDDPQYPSPSCLAPAVTAVYSTSQMDIDSYLSRNYWAGAWNTAGEPTDNVEIDSQTATDDGDAITVAHNLHEFLAESGVHTLTLGVIDTSSLTGSCELKVKVIDDEKPKLKSPDGVWSECTQVFASGTVAINATASGDSNADDYTGPWFGAGHTAASPNLLLSAPLWVDNVSSDADVTVSYSDDYTQIPGTPTTSGGQTTGPYDILWGAPLALGFHVITITATDNAETPNSDTCVIRINVVDKEAPSIDCGDDHTRHTDAGEPSYSGTSAGTLCTTQHPDCGAHLTLQTLFDQVSASDNAGAVTAIADTSNPPFPLDASETPYEFRFYVDDGAYGSNPPNSNACIIKVKVNDNEDPVITKCSIATAPLLELSDVGPNDKFGEDPSMQYVAAEQVSKEWSLALDDVVASDNVSYDVPSGALSVTKDSNNNSQNVGDSLGYGSYSIAVAVQDPPLDPTALTDSCTHSFKVVDVYPPIVDCAAVYMQFPDYTVTTDGNIVVYDDPNESYWTAPSSIDLTISAAFDNDQLVSTSLDVEVDGFPQSLAGSTLASGATDTLGGEGRLFDVTLTASDPAGHVSTCTFKIDVRDNQSPEYGAVDAQQAIDESFTGALTCSTTDIDSPDTGATDNVEILSSSVTATHIAHYDCAPNDSNGNDIYLPLPGSDCNQVLSDDSPLGLSLGIGFHQIRYDMKDTSQNPASVTVTVICRDKTPPTYECPDAVTIDLPVTPHVPYNLQLTGESGAASEQSISNTGQSLLWSITDNYDSTINCSTTTGLDCLATSDIDSSLSYRVDELNALSLPRGTHTFTLAGAKDVSHNTASESCTLTIHVRDVTAATISAIDATLYTDTNCEQTLRTSCTSQPWKREDALALLTVDDNDQGELTIQQCTAENASTCNTITTDSDLTLSIGEHVFRAVLDDYCIVDGSGAECTPGADFFTITVMDNTQPLVTCIGEEQMQAFSTFSGEAMSQTMEMDVGDATSVTDNNPGADTSPWSNMNYQCALTCSDSCGPSPAGNAYTCQSDQATPVSYGLYAVEYSANDNDLLYTNPGLAHSCTSLIRVRDITQPLITCPDDFAILSEDSRVNSSKDYMFLEADDIGTPDCTDNRNVDSCGSSAVLGTQLTWGDNTITYGVSDGTPDAFSCVDTPCSTNSCDQIVTTKDRTDPTLTCKLGGSLSVINGGSGSHTAYLTEHGAAAVTLTIEIDAADNREGTTGLPPASLVGSFSSDSPNLPIPADGSYGSRSDDFTFPVGEHTIKYEVTDQDGNDHACTFVVTVIDAMYPRVKSGGSCPTDIEVRNPDPNDTTPGYFGVAEPSYDVSGNYEDNVQDSANLFATYSIGSSNAVGAAVWATTGEENFPTSTTTTLLVSAHDYTDETKSNSINAWGSDSGTGQISRVGGTYVTTTLETAQDYGPGTQLEYCNFDVTVHPAYVKLPDTIDAFLNRVFIRVIDAGDFKYGAYIEVTTAVPWPHKLNGTFMKVCNEATASASCSSDSDFVNVDEPIPELDTSLSSATWCAAPANLSTLPALPSASCRQRFGTTLQFPAGCAVANQKFHLQFQSQCSPIGLNGSVEDLAIHACSSAYADSKRTIIINLTADNYCGRNLADVTIEGTLITLSQTLLDQYVTDHQYGDDTMPTSTTTWYDGEQVHALMHIKSPNAILNTVTLGVVNRGYYTDVTLDTLMAVVDLPAGISASTHTLTADANLATYHVVGVDGQDFASFSYEAEVPVQTTLYTKLTATAALTYNLGGSGTTSRRLLSRVFRKVLQADNEDSSLEGDRTASTQYLSLNLDLAADPSRIDADGNLGYGLVRIVDMPAGATTASTMATVDTHLERELGAASVDLQFVRNDGPNAMIVAVTHNTSLSAKLQEAVTNDNSQLHRNMKAAGGRPAIDPLFFFNGSVPSTSVTMTPGSDSGSDSLPAIVGGAVGGGVCCLLILFLLVRRKREAKETKSIEDAMPERVSRASSHASSNRSRRNSVGVAPLDFDGVQIAVGAADTKKSPVTPIAPAAWIDSDSD